MKVCLSVCTLGIYMYQTYNQCGSRIANVLMYLDILEREVHCTCTCKSIQMRQLFDTCFGPGIWGWGGGSREIFFSIKNFSKIARHLSHFVLTLFL